MKYILSALLVLHTLLPAPLLAAQDIVLNVAIVAKEVPDQVFVQEEDGIQNISFQRGQSDKQYQAQVPRPLPAELAAAKKVSLNYRLVAAWKDWKEQIFLKLQSQLPPMLAFKLYRTQEAFNDSALNAVDGLGTDLDSIIEKYSRSRAFHHQWRYEKKLPEHYLALRSARIWFDAAVALATRRNSPFGMDSDIKKIMDDYENLAARDATFRSRYRKYAGAGYVLRTLEDVNAADFAFVGDIQKLTVEGKAREAFGLNAKAISTLEALPPSARKNVEQRQGINLDLLRSNEAFLSQRIME